MTQSSIQVAIIQHPPVFLNLEESLARGESLAEEAASSGARVIVFPETWLPGYPVWLDFAPNAALWDHPPAKTLYRLLVENSIAMPGPHLDRLLELAGRLGAMIVMGAHERSGGALYNTMLFLAANGRDYAIHRKLMPTYTERLVWGRGDGSTMPILDVEGSRMGGLICWEHWMPLARAAMHAKHEHLHVAQWPSVKDLHQVASRHYAFEGQCYVLAAGTVLSKGEILAGARSLSGITAEALALLESMPVEEDALLMTGGSAVIGPDANYLAGPFVGEPGILYAECDPARITEGHLFLDTDGHYARPDIFQLIVDDRPHTGVQFSSGS